MSTSVRPARAADRETCIRLLTAQLIEHALPADPAGIAAGVDLALTPYSPAWLLLAVVDGAPVGIMLANQIVSVEKCGYTLWIEELYVTPQARQPVPRLRFSTSSLRKGGARECARSSSKWCLRRPRPSPSIETEDS